MAKKRKVGKPPNITERRLEKLKREASSEAVTYAWAIMFTVLRDKFGYGPVRLTRIWDEVNKLSDSVSRRYVDVDDLVVTLAEEAGIHLIDSSEEKKK